MIHRFMGLVAIALIVWVIVDPQSAGQFVRYVGESLIQALRSAGTEG